MIETVLISIMSLKLSLHWSYNRVIQKIFKTVLIIQTVLVIETKEYIYKLGTCYVLFLQYVVVFQTTGELKTNDQWLIHESFRVIQITLINTKQFNHVNFDFHIYSSHKNMKHASYFLSLKFNETRKTATVFEVPLGII